MFIAGWKVANPRLWGIRLYTVLQEPEHLFPVGVKILFIGNGLESLLLAIPVLSHKDHILATYDCALCPVQDQFQFGFVLR